MTALNGTLRRVRTIGRLTLVAATVATAACGSAPTGPSEPAPSAAVRAAPPEAPSLASGFMLSSGRGVKKGRNAR